MHYEWTGRYSRIVGVLIRHANILEKNYQKTVAIANEIELSGAEWLVLEAVVEHRSEINSMITISESIGVPQSTFSKITKSLCDKGLIEKYQAVGNKKNIILMPSDYAVDIYEKQVKYLYENVFVEFFRKLDVLDDASLNTVTEALELLNRNLEPKESECKPALIQLTEKK